MEANQIFYRRGEKVYYWDYNERTLKEGIVEEYFRRDGGWVAIHGLFECLKVNKVSRDKNALLETLCKKHEKEIKNLTKWLNRHETYLNDIKAYVEYDAESNEGRRYVAEENEGFGRSCDACGNLTDDEGFGRSCSESWESYVE